MTPEKLVAMRFVEVGGWVCLLLDAALYVRTAPGTVRQLVALVAMGLLLVGLRRVVAWNVLADHV